MDNNYTKCKYKKIAQHLREQIMNNTYPPNSILPTEQQLCDTFSVSRQTVRQALKFLVAEGFIERRQGSGSRVLPPQSKSSSVNRTVAIITTYISDYIFPSILREAEAVLSANNCTPLLYATSNQVSSERKILQNLLKYTDSQKLDGILIEGTKSALPNPNLDLYQEFQNRNIPLVFFNGNYEALQAVSILDDNYSGGYQLVEYLIRKGHTRIAGIFKTDDIQGHQRYAGFIAALRDYNLPIEDQNIFWYCTEDKVNMSPENSLWETHIAPTLKNCTAVVCYNDEVASYLVQSLLYHHIAVPKEMAVVSFDNSLYSDLTACRITSLSHGPYNVGHLAAESLLKLCNNEEVHSQKIPWFLVEKESS